MVVTPEGKPNSFCHLIYSSFATVRLSQRDLLELLKVARARNEACGLTGMLLYRDGTYLQYLEGRRSDIEELLERLSRDPRHRDIRILKEGSAAVRLFPEWSMAYKNLAGLRSAHLPGYSEALQAGIGATRGGRLKESRGEPRSNPVELLVDMFHGLLARA
jgi:hypothetical protein